MTTPDEGVREIQLSGKQLVFLFMAVTVVSVVIFLCGVLVGRGVQARTGMVDAPVLAGDDASDPAGEPAPGESAANTPTPRADVTFPRRLEKNETPAEKLVPRKDAPPKTAAAAPAAAGAPTPSTAPAAPPSAPSTTGPAAPTAAATTAKLAAEKPSPGIPTEPRGNGYAIQVAAFAGRGEAEVIVKRLTGKGYSAYLVTPQAGQPPMFRVRVGKFTDRAAAERVATRLEREEQFKPWITR
jgi:cell division septation protein DedD